MKTLQSSQETPGLIALPQVRPRREGLTVDTTLPTAQGAHITVSITGKHLLTSVSETADSFASELDY